MAIPSTVTTASPDTAIGRRSSDIPAKTPSVILIVPSFAKVLIIIPPLISAEPLFTSKI